MPSIKKAHKIFGNNIVFRDANVNDAQFILSLRTHQIRNKYLSSTSPEIEKQIVWLNNYKDSTNQAYFIIETNNGEKVGTVRLYDQIGDSFSWGSWIIQAGAPASFAIESALIVYHYAIYTLGFTKSHFEVRKGNKSVWQFHERFGAERKLETSDDYIYEISKDRIEQSLKKYSKFVPSLIRVVD